ncbi:hypothetical protein GSI_11915 [Ganoderma sinense ZZ0214-1]|uniref:BTB domain-containing protein n=1 Tax=Ganoderma sinense ZZ0214-1 TaxID=1077348 RepID=A0A2G8RXB8_9APHY|nr:hypothetical protein GSI_11915 [Ganoderma sinense ZZ0214-1]
MAASSSPSACQRDIEQFLIIKPEPCNIDRPAPNGVQRFARRVNCQWWRSPAVADTCWELEVAFPVFSAASNHRRPGFHSPLRPICETGFEFYVPSRTRDEEIWFEDGNIVLQTSNIEFRVYKGPLMTLSPVLQTMCQNTPTSPYPGAVKLTYLDLWDTTPDELRHVLRFVYGGTSRVEPSFQEIAAYIRFGRRYKATKLLQRSLDYLKRFYVTELSAWLRLPALDPPFFEPMHAIGVVNLARLLRKDGETLLPSALMRCCTLGAQLVDEYCLADRLSSADLSRCFEGKVKLLEASVRAAETLRTHMVSEECSHPRRCKAALQRFVDELLGPEDSTSGDGAGIRLANELRCLRWDLSFSLSSRRVFLQEAGAAVGADEERELCPRCFVRQLEEQRKIFARLPQMMGVSVQGWAVQGGAAA